MSVKLDRWVGRSPFVILYIFMLKYKCKKKRGKIDKIWDSNSVWHKDWLERMERQK